MLALFIFLAYLAVEGLLKLVSNYHPVVHVGADLVLLSVAGAWALAAVVERRRMPQLPWSWLILLHSCWVLLMLAHPLTASLFVGVAALKIHLAMVPLFFLVAAVVRSRDDALRLAAGVVAIACVPLVVSLAQYALGPASVLDLSARYWQNISYFHEWRPFGTSATPGGTAAQAFLSLPLAVALLFAREVPLAARRIAALALVLGIAALLVAGGRQLLLGSVVALMAMAALAAGRAHSRSLAALFTVLLLGAGTYLGVRAVLEPLAMRAVARDERSPDIWRDISVLDRWRTLADPEIYGSARIGAGERVVARLKRYPLGAGLGRTGSAGGVLRERMGSDPVQQEINREVGFSDSFFADMIAETGLPGTIMLTTLLVGLTLTAARLARAAHDPDMASLAGAVAGIFLAILITSWGSQPLLSNPITAYFWLYGGLVAAMTRFGTAPGGDAAAGAPGVRLVAA
jgi:hypothetical protein